MSEKKRDYLKNRKRFSFKFARFVVKILYHRPKFIYLDEEIPDGPFLFIVNHAGSNVPTRIECYFPKDFMMWGTHEMAEGWKAVKYYLIHTYYHQKKKFPLFFAYLIGFIFSPFANMFHRGMRLIPTYTDARFIQTIKESVRTLENNKGIVIYPEDSSEGYKEEIERFFNGFLMLSEAAKRKGIDLPIYVSYYIKKKKTFIVDKRVYFSALEKEFNGDKNAIAEHLRKRMNELANYQ